MGVTKSPDAYSIPEVTKKAQANVLCKTFWVKELARANLIKHRFKMFKTAKMNHPFINIKYK